MRRASKSPPRRTAASSRRLSSTGPGQSISSTSSASPLACRTQTKNLECGGSCAAGADGRPPVVWHAAGPEEGELHQRTYVATSADDGRRFAREKAFANDAGACGCCGVETLIDLVGRL